MESNQINALLLVEDDISSHALFEKVFGDFFENSYELKLFENCESMLGFLKEVSSDPIRLEPSVILLKVDTKSKDRLNTLKLIKTNSRWKNYPVIVYSDNSSQDLVNECYDLHANSFIHRDPDDDIFYTSIRSLLNFWFTVVLPPIVHKDF